MSKKMKDDEYPWLDKMTKQWNMSDREIIMWMVDLKDSKFTQEQKVSVYDFIEEHCDAFIFNTEDLYPVSPLLVTSNFSGWFSIFHK